MVQFLLLRLRQRSLGSSSNPRSDILAIKFSRSTVCTALAVQRCAAVTQHWQSGVFLNVMPDTQRGGVKSHLRLCYGVFFPHRVGYLKVYRYLTSDIYFIFIYTCNYCVWLGSQDINKLRYLLITVCVSAENSEDK
jgi:hypothetical protein